MLRKILVTGSHGQLGRALNEFYRDVSDVTLINTDVSDIDITDQDMVFAKVRETRPDVIINCAAYTAVDRCEEEYEKAYLINAEGARNISAAAREVDAVVVHISSDYVFDGKKTEPYVEEDEVNPQSAYGRTKWAGEEFVRQSTPKHFIIRTAWLFGDGKNFVRTMLKLAQTHEQVTVVKDQKGSPTSAKEVVRVIDLLIKTDHYGTYHATCEGACSWAEYAETIFKMADKDVEVLPVTSEEYIQKAQRPAYSVLENVKLKEIFHYNMSSWQEALEEYLIAEAEKEKESIVTMGKKRVLVTGANGYIGRHVVKALLDAGNEVLAADFKSDGLDERAQFVDTPIFSGDENIFEQLGQPDVCIHMAWRNGFVHNDDSHIVDLPNHYTFIKNMIAGGLKELAVMGTMHEVGYWEGAIEEDTPTKPTSLYGIAKNALRQMTYNLADGKDVVVQWLRAYYIIGDDMKNNSIFSKIVKSEKEGLPTFPFTTGKNKFDFIHVDELARQIAAASTQTEVTGVINCCTGKPMSLADKVNEFIEENGFAIRPEYGAYPDRPYDSPGIWGNAEKIQKIMENSGQ